VYLPAGGPVELDLTGAAGSFGVKWFNPRTGGPLIESSTRSVRGGGKIQLPEPSTEPKEDWLLIIRR